MISIAAVHVYRRAYTNMGIELKILTKNYFDRNDEKKNAICLPHLVQGADIFTEIIVKGFHLIAARDRNAKNEKYSISHASTSRFCSIVTISSS